MILKTSILLDFLAEQGWANVEAASGLPTRQSDFWLKGI